MKQYCTLALTCALAFNLYNAHATVPDLPQSFDSSVNSKSLSTERFLLNEGSKVYIVRDTTPDFVRAGQDVIFKNVKDRGFWTIVDSPRYADFVLHYVSLTNSRLQSGLMIETPSFYLNNKEKISFTRNYPDAYKVSSRYSDESESNNAKLALEYCQRLNSIISGILNGRINPDLKKRFTVEGEQSVPLPQDMDDTYVSEDLKSDTEELQYYINPILGGDYPSKKLNREDKSRVDISPFIYTANAENYEIECEIQLNTQSAEAGIVLYYDSVFQIGVGANISRRLRYQNDSEIGGESHPANSRKDHIWLKLRNENHIVTIFYSYDGEYWTREPWVKDISGYSFNSRAYRPLLPGLYCTGNGSATILSFKYKAIPKITSL